MVRFLLTCVLILGCFYCWVRVSGAGRNIGDIAGCSPVPSTNAVVIR